jgi:PAS domain-containing protein
LISLTLEAANAGFWYIDEKKGSLHWDIGLRNMYELDIDENIDNDKWMSFIHPIDKTRVINRIDQAQQTKGYYKDEYRIITKNNNLKYIQSFAIFRKNLDGSYKIFGITKDITKDIKNTQSLNEFKERFEIAIDSRQ